MHSLRTHRMRYGSSNLIGAAIVVAAMILFGLFAETHAADPANTTTAIHLTADKEINTQ